MAIRWPKDAKDHAKELADAFAGNLRTVSEAFASHDRVDSISKKHVDESHAALAAAGLNSKVWWKRSDTWTAVGAFLVGVSFSIPDLCSAFLGAMNAADGVKNAASVTGFVILAVSGIAIIAWAKYQSSLPTASIRRIVVVAIFVVALVGLAALVLWFYKIPPARN